MPWGFVAGAAISAVGGMIASDNAADAADNATAAQSASAADARALGREQLDWDKQKYNEQKPTRDAASAAALRLMEQQSKQAETQTAIAADYDNYNKTTYRPVEQGIVADAMGYDTPERRAAAAAEARAGVESGYSTSIAGLNRSLGRAGVAPGSGRSAALMQDATLMKAGALAGATTGATRNVETIGHARMMDAASLGRGLPSAQATAASTAIQAGNSSVNSGRAAIDDAAAGIPMVNQGYMGAIGAAGTAGNLYGQVAGAWDRRAAANDALMAQFGGAAGKALGSYFGG